MIRREDEEARSLFCIGRSSTVLNDEGHQARELFRQQRALVFSGGVAKPLLALFEERISTASFVAQTVEGLGHRHIESGAFVSNAVQIVLNRLDFIRWLENLTGSGHLSHAEGMVVETRCGGEDRLDWHSDDHQAVGLGVTVHLTDCGYEGGAFELREKQSKTVLFRHVHGQAGDVVIFDISDDLEHRVLPVSSGSARLVFTGWFFS